MKYQPAKVDTPMESENLPRDLSKHDRVVYLTEV